VRLDRERFLMSFTDPPAIIAARQVQIYCLHHMKVVAPGYTIVQNPYGHKTFAEYMNQHTSVGLGFAYVDTEDDCSTVYPPTGFEPATLDEFLVRYRALLLDVRPETYLALPQVTDADFDLGEIVRKDHVQVSRKWYDLQVQAIQRRDVGRYDKMQDSKAAKKIKGGVPDLSTPEARSGMARKRALGNADADHRSGKRHRGETETREGTPVSLRGTPSERDGTETPALPFASSSSFGGSVAGDKTPRFSPEEEVILADLNKEADSEVEKVLKAKELQEKELKEKESSKMAVD
jgi:hypothetical protein